MVACFFHMSSVCQKRYDKMRSDGSTWESHIPSSWAFRGCLAMGGGSSDEQAMRAQDVRLAKGAAGGGLQGPRMNGYTRMNAYS